MDARLKHSGMTEFTMEDKIMKSRMLAVLMVVLIPYSLFAQDSKMYGAGVKAGLNTAWFLNEEHIETATKLGLVAGGFVNYRISKALVLQVEGLYSMKGTRTPRQNFGSVSVPESNLNLGYIEIPVLAKLALPPSATWQPFILTGPSFGFLMRSEMFLEDRLGRRSDIDIDGFVRDRETAWVVGLAANHLSTSNQADFFFEFRYTLGLTPVFHAVSSDADADDKNQLFSVIFGVEF